jgi:S-(hydroxymethyl)glutathione dehydrogenase/alcohol dehydrogenase
MKAAVLHEFDTPLKIEELEIPEPAPGEVLVKMVACGICHSDYAAMKGRFPVPRPVVLGHEGAGIVEKVGSAVTKVKPGDHVICYALIHCGKCKQCENNNPTLCDVLSKTSFSGTMVDGSLRLKTRDAKSVYSFFSQSSWAEYAVIDESAAVKVPDEAPLDKMCLLSCGVSTGLGSAFNRAKVRPGSTAAVFGLGGVGLGALLGCTISGANKVYAIDIVDKKLEFARQLGATDTINSKRENPLERITAETGGVDYAFECIGNTDVMALAFDCTGKAGTTVIAGGAPPDQKMSINPTVFLVTQKVITGSSGCGGPIGEITRYVGLYMSGKLPLDKMVSQTFKLEEVNIALDALEKGELARGVILF